ncbi:APC family permease [Hyphococcus luteus]|uniref:APC family permease n=1 Tax=Hyphococcus luteus TaxID=2058213 RepID=UPI0013FD8198|nr:APC family permease [Marinicaulis flavus]
MQHTVTLRQLFSLGVGTIVGVAWLIVLGDAMINAGPIGAILAFAIGAACMIPIALCYGELGGIMPQTGGEIVYAQKIFGDNAAYAAGVSLVVIYLINCVFFGVSVGWLANELVPGLKGPLLYTVLGNEVHAGSVGVGMVCAGLIAYVNYRGVKWATAFQDIATYTLIAAACLLVIAGLLFGSVENLQPFIKKTDWGWGWGGVLGVLATTPYFFGGFSTIPQALGELANKSDKKKIGHVINACIFFSLLFYSFVILAVGMVLPSGRLEEFELPIAAAFENAFSSPLAGNFVLVAGIGGLLAVWNALFFAATRALYAMGQRGLFHPDLSRLHSTAQSPVAAIAAVSLISIAGLFLGQGFLLPVVNMTSTLLAGMYLLVTLGLLKARAQRIGADALPPFVAPGGRLMILAGAFFSAYLVVLSLVQQSAAAGWRWPPEWSVLLGVLAVAFAFRIRELRRIKPASS